MSQTQAIQAADQAACLAADKFRQLFYEAMDKRRDVVGKMYMDSASMVWNGEAVSGHQNISKFVDALPASQHTIKSVDAQPISAELTEGRKTLQLLTAGTVDFDGRLRSFTQSFLLTTLPSTASQGGEVWKITSDRFRFID